MRRKSIQVSSGTYCSALVQLDRRITSHMDLTNAESERAPMMALGGFRCDFSLMSGIGLGFEYSGENLFRHLFELLNLFLDRSAHGRDLRKRL